MPRYDLPKAAPEPLRQVQLLVNSVDQEHGVDWLPDWLAERGVEPERERAVELREGLRALALANNGRALDDSALAALNRAAGRLHVGVDGDGRLRFDGGGDPLDEVTAIAFEAMVDGSWGRLKACRNCCWAFYDYSPNRSATWCSMQLCGNRSKTRSYRSRRKSAT
jgi:predicted RNA-binding Zn ribbon-like protein